MGHGMRVPLAFVCVAVCISHFALAQYDENAIQKAFLKATENIKTRRAELTGIAGRSSGFCAAASNLKCPFSNAQHLTSRPSTRMSREIAENARIFEETTKELLFRDSPDGVTQKASVEQIKQVNGIGLNQGPLQNANAECVKRRTIQCNSRLQYRTGDGRCNHLQNPQWGQASTCMTRLLDPAYNDGVAEPRGGLRNNVLPNPRVISAVVNTNRNVSAQTYTHMLMQVGQFLDHDIALAPMESDPGEIINLGNPNNPIDCCSADRRDGPECFSFDIPRDDSFYSRFNQRCMNLPRSAPCSECNLGHREQQDALTAFVDGSQIYGSSDADHTRLRALVRGLLKFQVVANRQLPPRSFHPDQDRCSRPTEGKYCFRAGDERINEQPGLTAIHIIFLRQHNLVADKLNKLNPQWDDERTFQETKRIVVAQWQHVIYSEWLPIILGQQHMDRFRLNVQQQGTTIYDQTVNPTMLSEFATAAFRFGHTLIDGLFRLVNAQAATGTLELQETYFFPFGYYEGQLDPMLRGLVQQPGQQFDRFVTDHVTNHLYRLRNDSYGLDLIALNIQRGRDHGLRPYVDHVKYCTGKDIRRFSDLTQLMSEDSANKLSEAYQNVQEIDLFPAGISEYSVPGGVLGPTFACIQANQFHRAKFGDRFYFEHGNQAGSLTPNQLDEIRKSSMAKIICDNSDNIKEVQRNVFRPADSRLNPVIACSDIPRSDLRAWVQS